MIIALKKGETVSLEKLAPDLKTALIGLRWDPNPDRTTKFDLDVSVFLLGENRRLINKKHLIFYNNLSSPDPHNSVKLIKDNRTGEGEGDDEIIKIDFTKIDPNIARIALCVTIHDAEKSSLDFGQINNAHIRLVNLETEEEVLRYDLAEDFSLETAIIIAEFYRKDGWNIYALGSPYQGGLKGLLKYYQ
ncbi:MAG: TerD family protein [Prochloraceae cyanobacterium]